MNDQPASIPKTVILEYVVPDRHGERIYGIGTLAEGGKVTLLVEETFGSFPGGPGLEVYDVLKADGVLVSYEHFLTELEKEQ